MADEDHNKKYVESETVILEIMKSWLRHCIDEDSERRGRELEKRIGQMKKGEEETEKILSELEMYAEQPFAGQRNIKEVVDMINYLVLWLKKKIIDCDKFLKEYVLKTLVLHDCLFFDIYMIVYNSTYLLILILNSNRVFCYLLIISLLKIFTYLL